ncbi:MAG: trigger factor, partial [Terriglobales bacterium]
EEVLDTLVPAHIKSACERENLDPVSAPTLDGLAFEPGAPLKFKATFEVMPPIELGDYQSIRVPMPALEVAPVEVEKALEGLRRRHSRHEPSEDPAVADGHIAVVEARAAAGDEPQELAIEVGGEETLPEFSIALRGIRVGEERALEVNYPGDYPSPALAGKQRHYHLTLKRIERRVEPELNDTWAQEATGAESVAALRERIAGNLRAERAHDARHQVEEAVIEQLVAQSPFPLPQALVDRQVKSRLERNLHDLADRGVDPRRVKVDWPKLRARHEASAPREVRASLLLEKIAEREHFEPAQEAVEAEVQRAAKELGQTPEAVRARLTEQGVLDRIKNRLRQEQVLDYLVTQATEGGFGPSTPDAAPDTVKEHAHP